MVDVAADLLRHGVLRDLHAVPVDETLREELAQLDRALRRRDVLVVHRARDGRVVHAHLLGDLLHRQRPKPPEALREEAGLRVEDRLGDAGDRLLAARNRLLQLVDRGDPLADVGLRLFVRLRVLQHLEVLAGDVDVRQAPVVDARDPTVPDLHGMHLGVHVGNRLAGPAERPSRTRLERPQRREDVGVALVAHAQVLLHGREAPRADVVEVVALEDLADLLLVRRAVELVQLREKALLHARRPAAGRIELGDLPQHAADLRLALAGDHHEVRDRPVEVARRVQFADEHLRKRIVLRVDVRGRQLVDEVLLERLLRRLGVEELAPPLQGVRVGRVVRLGVVVHVGVVGVLRLALLRLGLALLLGRRRVLQRGLDALDDGVLAQLLVERRAQLRQAHRQHPQAVLHLQRHRLHLRLDLSLPYARLEIHRASRPPSPPTAPPSRA